MQAFVTTELLQSARRSAKRKRAARACLSCKEKRAKCSGFSPCTRCVNPAECTFQTRTALHLLETNRPSGLEAASPAIDNYFTTLTSNRQFPRVEVQPHSYFQNRFGYKFREDMDDQSEAKHLVSLHPGAYDQSNEVFADRLQATPALPSSRLPTHQDDSRFAYADRTRPPNIETSRIRQTIGWDNLSYSNQYNLLQPRVPTQSNSKHPLRPSLAYDAPSQPSLFQPSVQLGHVGAILQASDRVAIHAAAIHADTQAGANAHLVAACALPMEGGGSRSSAAGPLSGPDACNVLCDIDGSINDRDRGSVIGGGWTCPPRAWLESSLGDGGETRRHP